MVRVRLKGINRVSKVLAGGERVTYWYAWKGGPRLDGAPGSPEFVASYQRAHAARSLAAPGTLQEILDAYQRSGEFTGLAARTRADYVKQLHRIEAAFADFPLAALADRRARGEFMSWRDGLAARSRRQADYAWTVLARSLSWAKDRGLVVANPCERGGRLYKASRSDKVWSLDDEAAFLAAAPPHLRLPLLLAVWTGQRQGDLLRLPWSAYDGAAIRIRQSKTGRRVIIPVGAPLKTALEATPRRSPIILVNTRAHPWTESGFRASWGKAKGRAGLAGLTFHDLRGTSVTRLALAGATEPEIATFTGLSLADVRAILDAHYLHRDPVLARSAVAKLEAAALAAILPTARPTEPVASSVEIRKAQGNQVAGGPGFEPGLAESESAVLPLNYPPAGVASPPSPWQRAGDGPVPVGDGG